MLSGGTQQSDGHRQNLETGLFFGNERGLNFNWFRWSFWGDLEQLGLCDICEEELVSRQYFVWFFNFIQRLFLSYLKESRALLRPSHPFLSENGSRSLFGKGDTT